MDPVVRVQHGHDPVLVIDLVDHPVCATSGGGETSELSLETTTEPVRVLDEGTEHELDDRSRSALGQSLQLSLYRAGDPQFERLGRVRHGAVNRARNASPVT